jgi:hypothetical protein
MTILSESTGTCGGEQITRERFLREEPSGR